MSINSINALSQLSQQENIASTESILSVSGSYTADYFNNLKGGIRTGSGFLGMANICLDLETEKANWWKGGEFFIHGATTHGDTPTASYIGDLQTASNIEAGNHIYVQELWYKQLLGNTEWTVGVQDLNAEFVVSETGGLFLNSSLGIPSLLSYNVPVPIFPLTSIGLSGKWNINDQVTWQGAIFDGKPTPWEDNAYNLGWKFKEEDGFLYITEFQLSTHVNQLAGTYKLGTFYHSGLKEKDDLSGELTTIFNNDYGFYFLADQSIWQNENAGRNLTAFTQLSFCPSNINTHHYYWGGGLQLTGLMNKEGKDALGLAFAHAGFNNSEIKHETTIELSYQMPVLSNLTIQPDLQYIMHPSGTDEKLNDALALFIRVGIEF